MIWGGGFKKNVKKNLNSTVKMNKIPIYSEWETLLSVVLIMSLFSALSPFFPFFFFYISVLMTVKVAVKSSLSLYSLNSSFILTLLYLTDLRCYPISLPQNNAATTLLPTFNLKMAPARKLQAYPG